MRLLACASILAVVLVPLSPQEPAVPPPAAVVPAGPAVRIWCGEATEAFLRRRIALPAVPKSVRIAVTCDDECALFVNGERVAGTDNWMEVTVIDAVRLRAGDNVVAAHGRNTGGGPAALALWITWVDERGDAHEVVTDERWRVSPAGGDGWQAVGFDDARWQAPLVGGETPSGCNVYGYEPSAVVHVNEYAKLAEGIEDAVRALRSAPDAAAALRALDALERAAVRARAFAWAQQEVEKKAKR